MARTRPPRDTMPWIPIVARVAPGIYIVCSEHDPAKQYAVNMHTMVCTCPAFMVRGQDICKHIRAVEAVEQNEKERNHGGRQGPTQS